MPAFHAASLSELTRLLRRIHQLMASLPDTPWAQFVARTSALPAKTEAERLVVQRVGQDIFRQSLLDYWNGACAVTGLDQPEMLRASHIKSWSACENSPEERLDVFNGLLLSADIDAAFDCGLITFTDQGEVAHGHRLSTTAAARLSGMRVQNTALMTDKHRAYLKWHRLNRFDRVNPSE
jgi:predicted restriction endonuclease